MPLSNRFTRPRVAVGAAVCVGALAAGAAPAPAAFPGANGKIAFQSDRAGTNDDIWTVNPDGSEPVNLTPDTASQDVYPNWRADGRKIVYMSDSNALGTNPVPAGFESPDFELFSMNADGSKVRQITDNELDDENPAWSPDGKRLVFQRDLDPVRGQADYDLFTIKVSGSDERRITNTRARESAPNWSPDGRRIAFDSDRDGGGVEDAVDIYTMKPDGSHVRRLTDNPSFDGEPNWSPSGRKLSFQSYREEQLAIYTMRGDGSHETEVSDAVPDAFGSAWSPDGRFIAHSSFADVDIYTVDLRDGEVRNLTDDSPTFDYAPDWQPLPRRHH